MNLWSSDSQAINIVQSVKIGKRKLQGKFNWRSLRNNINESMRQVMTTNNWTKTKDTGQRLKSIGQRLKSSCWMVS